MSKRKATVSAEQKKAAKKEAVAEVEAAEEDDSELDTLFGRSCVHAYRHRRRRRGRGEKLIQSRQIKSRP